MDLDDMTQAEKVSLGGTGLTIVGAPLPWASVSLLGSSVSATGLDGDGLITLILAAVAAGIVLARDWEEIDRTAVLGIGGLTALIAVYKLISLPAVVTPGIGLYVTVVGAIVLAVGGWMGYSSTS